MRFYLFTVILLVLCSTAQAQSPSQSPSSALLSLAVDAGRLAGSARFCQADPDKVEAFISRMQGRLNAQSRDQVEKVLMNVEFKNQMTASSAKAPQGGCDAFLKLFDKILQDSL